MRGDIAGMFIFLTLFFLGLWQILVAWKRLNGFSLTGYPDRRKASIVLGAALLVASSTWYFSKPGHFASPDVEGIETLLVMLCAILASTFIQCILSSFLFSRKAKKLFVPEKSNKVEPKTVALDFEGENAPALLFAPETPLGCPVLLLHDYGEEAFGVSFLAGFLSERGHIVLAPELDGHGKNPRTISDPSMSELLWNSIEYIKEISGSTEIAVAGIGLGGILAILAGDDECVSHVVSIDPPSRDESGNIDSNAMRELKPPLVFRSFIRPPAKGTNGRITLSQIVSLLPPIKSPEKPSLTFIGTKKTWFNDPNSISKIVRLCGNRKSHLMDTNHRGLSLDEEVACLVSEILE